MTVRCDIIGETPEKTTVSNRTIIAAVFLAGQKLSSLEFGEQLISDHLRSKSEDTKSLWLLPY